MIGRESVDKYRILNAYDFLLHSVESAIIYFSTKKACCAYRRVRTNIMAYKNIEHHTEHHTEHEHLSQIIFRCISKCINLSSCHGNYISVGRTI